MASARRHTMPTKLMVPITLVLVALSGSICARASSDDSPCSFPAIFNFGDSNSDTGALSALFLWLPPPYGRTFFGMPAGRYSDGCLTVDFMAQNLGLRYLSVYLDSVGSNFTQGASFAIGGATIRRANGSTSLPLDVQTGQFQQFINRSRSVYNSIGGVYREILPKPENLLISKALYTFDIGQNDLAAGYLDNMTTEQVEAYVPDLMESISSAIQTVYNLGGRYFWVHNTAPLGCLPYALVFRPDLAAEKDGAGCSVALNAGPRFFNARLKETVARLRVALPEAAFTYVDVYAAMYRLMSQAKKMGFGDPLHVCCGYSGGKYNYDKDIGCGVKVEVNGTVLEGKSCEDPSKSVSWDGVHLTEAANKFVFDQIVDGALSDPLVPLRQACQGKGQ